MLLRVLVCDKLPIVRDGLRSLLDAESDIEVIEATDSGIEAMILVRRHHPHVVVTGLALSGMSGLELIRRLDKETLEPAPHVVVFAMDDSDETVTEVLHAGAHGLLVRDTTREELGSAVRAAAQGETMLAPRITHRLVDWFRLRDSHSSEALRPRVSGLTARERQVLMLIARGLSTDDIADSLTIGITTVRTHVYRLRRKLSLKDRAQLVSFAYEAGLMHPAAPARREEPRMAGLALAAG